MNEGHACSSQFYNYDPQGDNDIQETPFVMVKIALCEIIRSLFELIFLYLNNQIMQIGIGFNRCGIRGHCYTRTRGKEKGLKR